MRPPVTVPIVGLDTQQVVRRRFFDDAFEGVVTVAGLDLDEASAGDSGEPVETEPEKRAVSKSPQSDLVPRREHLDEARIEVQDVQVAVRLGRLAA